MKEKFPQEEYKKACTKLSPSQQSVQEAIAMIKPKKYARRKRKMFVGAAACMTMFLSLSVVAVAATDGQIVENVTEYVSVLFRNLTIDNHASTPYETAAYAEDGTKITFSHGYGKNGEYYVTLIYHADSGRLGIKVGETETDITQELKEKGTYSQEYTYEGKKCRLTVTGQPENAQLKTEIIESKTSL